MAIADPPTIGQLADHKRQERADARQGLTVHINEGVAPTRDLVVSEAFGPTIQGEGASVGYPCYFLRLGGCALHCSWCDTPYTWSFSEKLAAHHESRKVYDPRVELTPMSIADITGKLRYLGADYANPPKMLVVSGGEPMLQQTRLIPLLQHPFFAGWRVEIETAGVIPPTGELVRAVTQFNVSPKLEHSGNELSKRYKPNALEALQMTGKATWKFVVAEPGDFAEIDQLVNKHQLDPVYIMFEGTDEASLRTHAEATVDDVLQRGWRISPRLQIDIWGPKRGV